MADYMVTYDLKRPDQDYRHLIKALKLYPNSLRILNSTWLIKSAVSPDHILADLEQYVDVNDQMFIAMVQPAAAWSDSLGVDQVLRFFSNP